MTTPITNLDQLFAAATDAIGKGDMVSSAVMCLSDAHVCRERGREAFAVRRLIDSLAYSVGVLHPMHRAACAYRDGLANHDADAVDQAFGLGDLPSDLHKPAPTPEEDRRMVARCTAPTSAERFEGRDLDAVFLLADGFGRQTIRQIADQCWDFSHVRDSSDGAIAAMAAKCREIIDARG